MFRLLAAVLALTVVATAREDFRSGVDRGIDFLETRLHDDPVDFVAANQLFARLMRRARSSGRLDDLRRAEEVAALSLKAMKAGQNPGGLAALTQARLAAHRFAEARDLALQLEKIEPGKPATSQLLGDALLELGDLEGAERAFQQAIARSTEDMASEARLARIAWLRGQPEESARHLDHALAFARQGSDRETLAWILVQRGEHAFRRGEHELAEKLYLEGQSLAPAHWSVTEHLAELRGAQGREVEAAELFEKAASTTGRPELWQALGDLHAFYKRPAEAKAAHDHALAGYRASLARGEVLYVHHLAGFFSDSQEDANQAVEFARRDLTLRKTGAAWDALAWAQYRAGDFTAAIESSTKALATGLADPHVLYHAAMIRMSAGAVSEGQALLRRCAQINPHFASFHIHR